MVKRAEQRKREILRELISEFLRTGKAVGSKVLAARSSARVSPATVRNDLAELTREGLLEQLHPSAGRVPTALALRLFVDELLEIDRVSEAERGQIAQSLASVSSGEQPLFAGAARLLSRLCQQAGLVLAEGLKEMRLERIELVRIGRNRILIVLVTVHGMIHERALATDEEFSGADLQRFTNFLNAQIDGCTFAQLRRRLERERSRVGRAAGLLIERAAAVARGAADATGAEGELYVEGQANIVGSGDLRHNARALQRLFEMLEDRKHVAALLTRVAHGQGVQVFIGEEAGLGPVPVSLVAAPCRIEEGVVVGTLGVIGSTRMNYSRVIPLVSCLATLVGERYARGDDAPPAAGWWN